MMVEMDKISFSERSATNPHQKHKGIFSPTISTKPLVTLPKDDPMHIDKTRFKPLMEQENNANIQTIFVCIVENKMMLFVSVQRNMAHMHHAPIHNQRKNKHVQS
jgi:hypothetical protein